MTHISRKRIKKEFATEFVDQFLMFLASVQSKVDAKALANELFSQTERVMLAKRLAIIVLLVRGYSFLQIEESLKVTPQTIVRIWKGLKNGQYQKIVRYARRHTKHFKKETAMDAFIRIIHIGMPPRSGKGRWELIQKSFPASLTA